MCSSDLQNPTSQKYWIMTAAPQTYITSPEMERTSSYLQTEKPMRWGCIGYWSCLLYTSIVEVVFILKRNRKIVMKGKDDFFTFTLIVLFALMIFPLSEMGSVVAVSYTHLDVYKRQMYLRPAAIIMWQSMPELV